jgi:CHAT domain-containing protein
MKISYGCAALFSSFALVVAIRPAIAQSLTIAPHSLYAAADLSQLQEQENPIADATLLLEQGRSLYESGRFAEAIQVWQQALERYQQQGEVLNQAMVLSNLALAYQQVGDWEQANTAIATSLDLLSTQPDTVEAAQVRAQALNTQGLLQLGAGNPQAALTTWEQAEAFYAQTADAVGVVRTQINQAQALQDLGLYRQATDRLTALSQQLQTQPDSPIKAIALRGLGNALQTVGDFTQARLVLEQSWEIAQFLQLPQEADAAALSLGNTARAQGNVAEAIDFYQQISATAAPSLRVQAQLNLLRLLIETEQIESAQALISSLPTLLPSLPLSRAAVYAHINFAQTLQQFEEHQDLTAEQPIETEINLLPTVPLLSTVQPTEQQRAQLLATAVQQSRQLGDVRAEAYALGYLGGLYEQSQQWTEAQTLTQQALLKAQMINAPEIVYLWQWQLGRVLKAQGDKQGAIATYSQSIETLQSLRGDLVAIDSDIQFSFREQVEPVYRELVTLLINSETGEPDQKNLVQVKQVVESLQLAELDNYFREACLDLVPVQIEEIDPKAAVIYSIILEDRLSVIVTLPDRPPLSYQTALSKSEIETTAIQLRQSLRPTAPTRTRLQLAQTIYDWLVRPAAAALAESEIETLAFVLDGVFQNLPMAVLHDGEQYLIENYNVALTPGLELLPPQRSIQQEFQVLGGGLTEARQGFPALPSVEQELSQIQSEVPTSRILLNQDMTRANLQDQLQSVPFPIVHLATHGQFSSDATNTFILTWDSRINIRELGDILQRRQGDQSRTIELLVLSACQTAVGDERAALGIAGMAVRSGARSTLASLWSLNDQAAAELIGHFYRELAVPGTTKAAALRRAQLSLLQNPQYRQPYFWAAFVLLGNWL